MEARAAAILRDKLVDRRQRLEGAIAGGGHAEGLVRLLKEVDTALERMDGGGYGVCEVCRENVEEDFLQANPLIQYCLCSLSPAQQRTLENDLGLAVRVQWALLPRQDVSVHGWENHFRYEPAGPVSGDYCDLVEESNGASNLHVLVGDVSGKGVAASLLMAHLNALIRTLLHTGAGVGEVFGRANRLFGEHTMRTSHYVTLAAARLAPDGGVQICNAGHCPPVLLRGGDADTIGATGLPVGISPQASYTVRDLRLERGDTLVFYTDGLTEAVNAEDDPYGSERLVALLRQIGSLRPRDLAAACLRDLAAFQGGVPRDDDLTLMVVRRTH